MSIIQWRLIEKVSLSQSDNIVEINTANTPSVTEKVVQEITPTSEPQPANEEVPKPVESPVPVEDAGEENLVGTEYQNEVQSEESSQGPVEENGQAASSEINEESTDSPTLEETQGEDSPVS